MRRFLAGAALAMIGLNSVLIWVHNVDDREGPTAWYCDAFPQTQWSDRDTCLDANASALPYWYPAVPLLAYHWVVDGRTADYISRQLWPYYWRF